MLQNILLESLKIDNQSDEVKAVIDIYDKTKEILERTQVALGRKIEYGVINMSTSNSYNIPSDGRTNAIQI